jgi:hypothetical protein
MPLDDPLRTERPKGAYWVKLSDGRWVIGLMGLTRRDIPWIFVDPERGRLFSWSGTFTVGPRIDPPAD